ncbi:MAG: GNAT family N-acetyltransferase [Paraglaciecola sp.]
MKLVKANDTHLTELMGWFEDEAQLVMWSGPGFRYPYDVVTFKQDLKLTTLPSFSLLSPQGALLAFGQYYLRENRCHLGRLVVNPALFFTAIATRRFTGIWPILLARESLSLRPLSGKPCP